MADSIDISSKYVCHTYSEDKDKSGEDFSKMIFSDTPPKISDYRHIADMNLICKAKCLFNKNGQCIANGITVNAAYSPSPKCITYMKP